MYCRANCKRRDHKRIADLLFEKIKNLIGDFFSKDQKADEKTYIVIMLRLGLTLTTNPAWSIWYAKLE